MFDLEMQLGWDQQFGAIVQTSPSGLGKKQHLYQCKISNLDVRSFPNGVLPCKPLNLDKWFTFLSYFYSACFIFC